MTNPHKVSKGMEIYLDRTQCDKFGVNYYGEGRTITLCAKMILESKGGDGYDEAHKRMLQPSVEAGSDLVLKQTDIPGWFPIVAERA